MLNDKINYPYPVIRSYTEDYKTTIFTGSLTVNLQPDGYLVRPNFDTNNKSILDMISSGKLTYALEAVSPATWYRKLFLIKGNKPIRIEPALVHERVELIPCIIAAVPINGFSNYDFEDDYCGITFDINAGDIIAIGETRYFSAFYQDDVIKNGSSIVKINGDKRLTEIACDFSGSIISITLPHDQYERYKNCGYNPSKYKTLNAILTVPALVEAIGIIANDEEYPEQTSGFESKAWYKTIVVNLKRVTENNETKYRQMLKKPFAAAELLLGNNYASALQFVNQVQ